MGNGYGVQVEQLRAHAGNVEAIRARFEAVKSAGAHIAQDDEAYGLLCGWMSGILEGRHTRLDGVIAKVEENLRLVAESLRDTADDYQAVDDDNADRVRAAGGGSAS